MAMDDLVSHVKEKLAAKSSRGKIVHPAKSELFILPHYPLRDRIVSPHAPPAGDTTTEFSVLSYNILADCYAHSAGYWYCSSLCHLRRHESLMGELSVLDYGSVLCFQEVTEEYFSSLLLPSLREKGYEGVFHQKGQRHKKSAKSEDGLATFYKQDRCFLFSQQPIVLNDLMVGAWKHRFGNDKLTDSCYRDTVALLTAFSIDYKIVTVANVHIHFDWMRPDVQALQACLVLSKLVEFAKTTKSCAYLFCGDFNSQPSSAQYQLLTGGALTAEMKAAFVQSSSTIPVKRTEMLFKSTIDYVPYFEVFRDLYQIPEAVKSAYLTVQGSEPDYTNYTGDFHGCLDYIFYSEGLCPCSVLSLPSESELRSEVALPNSVMSSDHLSIKAEFMLTSGEDTQVDRNKNSY